MTHLRCGVAALAATAFLGGCGGAPAVDRGESAGQAVPPAAPAAPVAPVASAAPVATAAAESTGDVGSTAKSTEQRVRIEPTDRAIIYTAELTVRTDTVPAAADRAKAIVTAAGGYVAEERSSSSARTDMSVITFRVPPARYAEVLARLDREIGRRESLHQGADDVTEEVADVASRVKSARATLDRLRTLLGKASSIGEILQIEREISTREAELESLQARQKALAARTEMASVTLTLLAPAAPAARPRPSVPGFFAGLRAGWRALITSAEVALTMLGALLPWLVLAAVVWLVVAAILRRVGARRPAPPAAPGPPNPPTIPAPPAPAPASPTTSTPAPGSAPEAAAPTTTPASR